VANGSHPNQTAFESVRYLNARGECLKWRAFWKLFSAAANPAPGFHSVFAADKPRQPLTGHSQWDPQGVYAIISTPTDRCQCERWGRLFAFQSENLEDLKKPVLFDTLNSAVASKRSRRSRSGYRGFCALYLASHFKAPINDGDRRQSAYR